MVALEIFNKKKIELSSAGQWTYYTKGRWNSEPWERVTPPLHMTNKKEATEYFRNYFKEQREFLMLEIAARVLSKKPAGSGGRK